MKTIITNNLLKFTLVTAVLTVLFRFALSTSITNKLAVSVAASSIIYAILMWINGRFFGRKEHEYLPIYDIGFRFHLATFLTHNIISLLWFKLGLESHYEKISIIYITALIWSIFLAIHFFYFLSIRKTTIKNLNKEDLFE